MITEGVILRTRKKLKVKDTCPFCGKEIALNVSKCKNCQRKIIKCIICYKPINPVDEGVVQCKAENPCGAVYHKKHLFEWLNNKKSCPHCKGELRKVMYRKTKVKEIIRIEAYPTEERIRIKPVEISFLEFCNLDRTRYNDLKDVKRVLSSVPISLRNKLSISRSAVIGQILAYVATIVFIGAGIAVKRNYIQSNAPDEDFIVAGFLLFVIGCLLDFTSRQMILYQIIFKQKVQGYNYYGEITETERVVLSGTKVIAINFSNLNLVNIDELLSTFSNVRYIDISYNNIKEVNLKIGNSIEILNLSHNKIEKLKRSWDKIWGQLVVLDLSNNELKDVPEFRYLGLQFLNLSNNKIAISPGFIYLKELIHLDLSNNKLRRVRSYSLPSLVILNLANNEIMHISNDHKLPKLKEIYLADSPISYIKQFTPTESNLRQQQQAPEYMDYNQLNKTLFRRIVQLFISTVSFCKGIL